MLTNEKADMKGFFEELEEKMELVKEQLLDRFDLQCSKNLANFPFLLGQELWLDSEKLDYKDKLRIYLLICKCYHSYLTSDRKFINMIIVVFSFIQRGTEPQFL